MNFSDDISSFYEPRGKSVNVDRADDVAAPELSDEEKIVDRPIGALLPIKEIGHMRNIHSFECILCKITRLCHVSQSGELRLRLLFGSKSNLRAFNARRFLLNKIIVIIKERE